MLFSSFRFLSSFNSTFLYSSSINHSNSLSPLGLRFYSHFRSISNDFNVDNVVWSFHRMLQMRHTPSIVEFNKILTSLVKTKNHYSTVLSFSRQMEFHGIIIDLCTLNVVINCYCHLGQITFAFSVFTKILKIGYHPNTITLTTLMKGLCLNGKVKETLHFHDHVLALGFHLNHVSYGTLINGLCKMGETRAALQLLRRIEGKLVNTDVVMYTSIIDSLCKDKLVTHANELYSEMILKKISPNVVTFSSLIYGFCIAGQLKEAFGLFCEMVLKNINPNVYTLIYWLMLFVRKERSEKLKM